MKSALARCAGATPKAAWLSDTEILFQEQAAKEKEPSIYRAPVADLKARKLVLKNARVPSASQ